jgi:D-3-phosphoglycerate dehydrogenase
MKSWKILISSKHMNSVLDQYKHLLVENNIEWDSIVREQIVKKSELLPNIEKYDGVICSDDELDAEVLMKAKKLKVICKWGVGIDSIDQDIAKKNGIKIFNSPGAFSEGCAVITMGMMINFARLIIPAHKSIENGEWEKFQGMALAGKKLGIIGFGNIGKEVAKRANAFDMKIYVNDINLESLENKDYHLVDKEFIYKNCDFISLHVPLTQDTRHLITKEQLKLMKASAFIINTARGPIIKESDLIWALENKIISGVGLDVFESEPLALDNPLRKLSNCIFSAHNSFNTKEAVEFVHGNTINNMIKGLKQYA